MTPPSLPSPAAALEALLPRLCPVRTEAVDLEQAAGRILAQPIAADRPSPAADVSAMDGYAVRAADALATDRLPVAARALIGHEPPPLPPGAAVHIVTGAPLPPGADAVIRREDVHEGPTEIVLTPAARAIKPGTALRRRGENARAGEEIVAPGSLIDAGAMGALASFGVTRPLVYRRVRLAIITTGDEVVDPGETPTDWRLRDSNGPALAAMLSRPAWVRLAHRARVEDDLPAIERAIRRALDDADAVILTGGVSMGDRDHVPAAVRGVGAETIFHKIPQRPGRPVLGAGLPDGRAILALPGNPVSVLVTARRLATGALERLSGLAHPAPPPVVTVPDDGKRLDLWWHRLVRLSAPGAAALANTRGSGDVPSAARADGFVEVPPGAGLDERRPYYAWLW